MVMNVFLFNRYLIRTCVESHGLNSIRNPNVLEVSLNKAYWESQNRDLSGSRLSSSSVPSTAPPQDIGVGVADTSSDLPLTHLPQYTRSGCLSAPCVKVITVNRVQSTYVVPTFITPGGDIQTLNALCKYVTIQTPMFVSSSATVEHLNSVMHVAYLATFIVFMCPTSIDVTPQVVELKLSATHTYLTLASMLVRRASVRMWDPGISSPLLLPLLEGHSPLQEKVRVRVKADREMQWVNLILGI